MSLVVKLVIGVHYAAQVDTTHFLRRAFALQVLQQAVDDVADVSLVFQVVHVLWKSECVCERLVVCNLR